jgi:hypothetical protein
MSHIDRTNDLQAKLDPERRTRFNFIIDSRTSNFTLIDIPAIGLEQQNKPATFDYYLYINTLTGFL